MTGRGIAERPLRVLELRDTYEVGGPGKTIIETYRSINAERFHVHLGVFATKNETADTPFVSAARACGMPVHVLRGFNQYDPCLIIQLIRLVDSLAIDIIHAHEVKSDVIAYLAALFRPVPIVTTLHGWIGNGVKQRFFIQLDKIVARRFNRVIAVSKAIERELLRAQVEPRKICLLHNGIVLERYKKTGGQGGLEAIVQRRVPSPVIASIGRLSREKGHADLIEAVALVRKAGQKVSLILAGDGPERQSLTHQIRNLGLDDAVYLPGYIQDPRRLLEEIDLMVLPSHTEGLPNAALEALLMEVPVLATSVGGTPEVIAHGVNGCLVPSRQPEALAAAIVDFLRNREAWRRMALSGRDFVKSRFDFQARTAKLEALYDELAVSHGRMTA